MILTIVGTTAILLYLSLLEVKAYLCLRTAKREPQGERQQDTITILQPILSGDPLLGNALQHNLSTAPTWAKFLWLIDEADEVARHLAQTLIQDTDQVEVMLCPPVPPRVNPKAFKLEYALAQVKTPYLAVLDDDTMLEPQSLSCGLFRLQDGEIFTGLPYYLEGSTYWSALTAHFVNNNSILTYLPTLNFSKPISINGMFYIMSTETLQKMGGYTSILNDLCDDYALARLIKQHNGNIIQGTTPVAIQTSAPNAASYVRLMHRWFVFAQTLLFDQSIPSQALLLLFLGMPPILLWIGLISLCSSAFGLLSLFVVLLIRYTTIRYLHQLIFKQPVIFSFWMSLVSELLQPFHLTHALIEKRITWRSRLIQIKKDGTFTYEGI